MEQVFKDFVDQKFSALDSFPGASWTVLAEPVAHGSIHRLTMQAGTVIPPHTHPVDEFVYVLSGSIKTGVRMRAEDNLPLRVDSLTPHMLAAEVVITPATTRFLQEAVQRGCALHPGKPMLAEQIVLMVAFMRA